MVPVVVGGMIVGVGVIAVVLMVLSALLRAAVGLANRMVGPAKPDAVIGWDWDADEDDELVLQEGARAVPEPSLGKGMGLLLIAGVANLILGAALRFVLMLEPGRDTSDDLAAAAAAHLLGVAAGFLVLMGLLAASLPTTPKRAALAALLFHVLVVAIVGFVLGLAYAVLA